MVNVLNLDFRTGLNYANFRNWLPYTFTPCGIVIQFISL